MYCFKLRRTTLSSAVVLQEEVRPLAVYDQQPMYSSQKYIIMKCSCVMCVRINTVFSVVFYVVKAKVFVMSRAK